MMVGYPLFLKLEGKQCLVFGGGKVALRKIKALLRRGALVTCVSRDFCKPLKKLVGAPLVGARKRAGTQRPEGGETPPLQLKRIKNGRINIAINGAKLVIAATSDRKFNARAAQVCRRKKVLINVVDNPELCDFYVPAVVERGPLQIAISTGGTSPLFAKRLREELQKVIPASTGHLLKKLGKIRRRKI